MANLLILNNYDFPCLGDCRVKTIYDGIWTKPEKDSISEKYTLPPFSVLDEVLRADDNICWPGGREDDSLNNDFKYHILGFEH